MRKIKILIVLITLTARAVCQTPYPDTYRKLNASETRLEEYKDDDEALMLKLRQLDIINQSRAKKGVPPVKLDILASRVANKMSREAAENKYISHWNLKGEKPYHRYAFAGGKDHISENVYSQSTTGKYEQSPDLIAELMIKGHGSFMAERAPNDGHRKTILDKAHNYVGIGYFQTYDQFRYNEEFIDRYFEAIEAPAELKVNEESIIRFSNPGTAYPYYLVIFREDFPKPYTPARLNKTGSYPDYSDEVIKSMPAWELYKEKSGKTYTVPVRFSKPGLYYIQVYIDRNEIKTPAKLNTKGKTIATGIVIRVSG
jgi:uncharacterized protein YkwD